MAAASSCSDIIPREKYDVFLSFRGEDTRNIFTSHLYAALCQKKILTYKDDEELERGDDISPALLKAISESKLSVIIFSKNYASSTWCLDELVHILQCRREQIVIPIFYGIDPSVVRKQSGSYADAFVQHEERFKNRKDKVLRWRNALKTAADISGFDSETIRPEAELVKRVVDDILAKLNRKLQITRGFEGLVGMEKHIQQVELLLCLNPLDVQTVGIWGMGGIGKTTIAKVVFDHLSSQFDACCFVADVREAAEKLGLNDLRNKLLRTLLEEENIYTAAPTFVRPRLRRTKALIVLDDVSELRQLEDLAGDDFGPGSRILVTTRNKRILGNLVDDDKIYEVKELDVDKALELFHLIAFRNKSPPGDYTTFAREVVDYAGGNPLALKILGGVFYHCKSNKDWKGELEKLKNFPDEDIQKVLRFSYDGLRKNEKQIFLEIACCHKGKHIDEAERILNACGFSANAGVRLLIDMALISVDESSRFVEMHDLIQEMGREIVRDVKDPGKRSRLWLANEVRHLLEKNTGTEDIECIVMNMDDLIRDLYVNAASFEKMRNLRLLDLYSYNRDVTKVHLPPGFEFLPEALKYLRWHFYPLTSLPSRFSSENLVELHMRNSRLEQLWNKGVQINLGSLKRIDLAWSKHLAEVPDLSESPNLESICLVGCTSLVQLSSSFQHLDKLTCLILNGCSNLKILPEMPGNLETLYLDSTAIEELPSSIWCLEKLHTFRLEECKELKNLPSSTCRLNSLRVLRLYGCLYLESLPVELPSGLLKLDVINCKRLGSLPVELPSGLLKLYLSNCESLGSLPVELPPGLLKLDVINCKRLGSLPVELPSGLTELYLSNCESLGSLPVELPPGLLKLHVINCKRLGSLPVELPSGLTELYLSNCESLGSLPVELPPGLLKLDVINCKRLGSLPVELPSGLTELYLSNCESLGSLPVELPSGLTELYLSNCESLGSLPVELPPGLLKLHVINCKRLGSLPVELPSGLTELYLSNCESLGSLPVELPPGLLKLDVINCKRLGSLPVELPSGLESMDLSNCESLGSLPVKLPSGLTELYLSNCESLGSLPVELPPGLNYLYLTDCKSLGSLPKLPWLLRRLNADGCTSLETVSSSMRTAPIQGRDQLQFSFINCVKLDQSARSNIMADAQLRYASRPLSQWSTIEFVCPGNEIPKWMRYQSEGCSINIKLPPHSFRQGFLGYALCIVLAFNNYTRPPGPTYFRCKTHHKTNNGHKDRCDLDIRPPDDIILNSDHVFLWHFCPRFVRSESTINLDDWVKASEVSFDFMLYHDSYQNGSREKNPLDLSTVRVERCGVSLLYDEDVVMEPKQVVEEEVSLLYAQDFENLLGELEALIDEGVVMEPKQVVVEEEEVSLLYAQDFENLLGEVEALMKM